MATDPRWRIEVDHDRCMVTQGCVHALPQLFEVGDDGALHVTGEADGEDQLVRDVVAECPTAALRLTRSDDPSSTAPASNAGQK